MERANIDEQRPLIFRDSIPPKVVDHRTSFQRKLAIYIILTSTLLERLAFYALAANIVIILQSSKFNWTSTNAVTTLYIFSGISYTTSIVFAAISDAKLGRAKTIIIGFILYLIGYIMMIFILYQKTKEDLCKIQNITQRFPFSENCSLLILLTLICIAIGVGAVQSNMAVFGAEQIQDSKLASRYFDKYMIAVNIGGIIATSVIPYIEKNSEDYYIGVIVSASMLCISALLFIIGRRYYIYIDPHDTVTTKCLPVVISAFKSWYRHRKNKQSQKEEIGLYQNKESMVADEQPPLSFLDFAKAANGGIFIDRTVDNIKLVPRVLVVFTILLPYWLIYDQLDATFPLQGQQMQNPHAEQFVTFMSLADPITIIIGLFILNRFVYKYLNTGNQASILTTKFIVGMCFASITMSLTGLIEGIRQKHCRQGKNQSNLSIYAQLPQYIGIGLAELFTTVASYQYAYLAAPRSAQSLLMSLRFFFLGISSFIGAAYMQLFSRNFIELNFRCLGDPKRHWPFYGYYFILGGLQLIFIIIFILCQKKFEIIKISREKDQYSIFL